MAGISINPFYAIAVLVPGITAGYFVWTLRRVLVAPHPHVQKRDAPNYVLITLGAFLVPLFILGFYPALLLNVINSAIRMIPGLR